MWEQIPKTIEEASKSALGIIALIIIVIGLIAYFLFRKESHQIKVGIFFIVIIAAGLLVFQIRTPSEERDGPDPVEEINGAIKLSECERTTSSDLMEILQKIVTGQVESDYYINVCIPDTGWLAKAKSGLLTDTKTGSHFILISFEPWNVVGRLYLAGNSPDVEVADLLLIRGRISRIREASKGRNPRTGEIIEIPASVSVIGNASVNPKIDDEIENKKVLSEYDLRRKIVESITLIYKVPISSIDNSMAFEEDFPADPYEEKLNLKGLRLVELTIEIEKFAQCHLEDEIIETVKTVGDLIMVAIPRCSKPQ